MTALLEVEALTARLPVEGRMQTVLRDVSLDIGVGDAVGLVGESRSGQEHDGARDRAAAAAGRPGRGTVRFERQNVSELRGGALRRFRGDVAIVFQDPRAHVNPVRRIGDFMTEALRTNRNADRAEASRRAAEPVPARPAASSPET